MRFLLFLLLLPLNVFSQEIISSLEIEGNKIISDAKIISKIKIRPGSLFNENIINQDIKTLYAAGFFESVEVEKKATPEGVIVIFKVKEKAVIEEIIIEGERFIREKKLKEAAQLEEGSFVDEYKVKEAARRIKDLYDKKGFSQSEVSYQIDTLEGKAKVKFLIDEKRILKVVKIDIEGNKTFPSRKILRLMKTKKSWLFNRGIFKEKVLKDDIERIKDFYKREGFSDVEVKITTSFKRKGVFVTVNISEGKRYYIGRIKVEGNKNLSLQDIKEVMEIKEGDIFSQQVVYEEAMRIRELYIDHGYIFSRVEPYSIFNLDTERIDVSYKIIENEVAFIERIDIRGNIKTKDEVIRRELRVFPAERFDGKKVRRSKERLENLGFFEEIRLGTEPGSKPNWVNLVVEVKEAKTGYLSFGGGYSSIDEFVGFIELRQRNFDYQNFSTFTGAGQDLSLYLSSGNITEQYQISFTNPWIFDKPISFGFDGYKKGHEREGDVGYGYEEDIRGGALRLGREFSEYLRGGLTYRLERVEISDVSSGATQELKNEEGKVDLSSLEFNLSFDSRDNIFSPSRGLYLLNQFQFTGGFLGGDRDFIKYSARFSIYFDFQEKGVLESRFRLGIAEPFSDTQKLPIYERFFAGGSATIRGYEERKVGPIDSATNDPIGGEAMFVFNLEHTLPLADFLKLAVFFDTGEVWKERGDFLKGGFKSSLGMGLRVKTPLGPISIDYGWPLNTVPGEKDKEGRFHFNISRGF